MRALTFSLNVLPDNLQADINISGQLCIYSYNVIEEQWPATVDVNCIGEYFFFFFAVCANICRFFLVSCCLI